MYDRPTKTQLIGAVRDFLENVAMPELEGHAAFHARVAVNALEIVLRELELGPAAEAAESERLRLLLGRDGPLADQNRELCRRLRAGELTLDTPGMAEHLRETTLAKLAVDQPRYVRYRRALERGGS
jgi:uncharacterized protein DUF6285